MEDADGDDESGGGSIDYAEDFHWEERNGINSKESGEINSPYFDPYQLRPRF